MKKGLLIIFGILFLVIFFDVLVMFKNGVSPLSIGGLIIPIGCIILIMRDVGKDAKAKKAKEQLELSSGLNEGSGSEPGSNEANDPEKEEQFDPGHDEPDDQDESVHDGPDDQDESVHDEPNDQDESVQDEPENV